MTVPAAAFDVKMIVNNGLIIMQVWGPMIRAWLEECLPADAHRRCSGRVTIAVRQVPLRATI